MVKLQNLLTSWFVPGVLSKLFFVCRISQIYQIINGYFLFVKGIIGDVYRIIKIFRHIKIIKKYIVSHIKGH